MAMYPLLLELVPLAVDLVSTDGTVASTCVKRERVCECMLRSLVGFARGHCGRERVGTSGSELYVDLSPVHASVVHLQRFLCVAIKLNE
jgi:hypothetical protein